MENAKTHTEIAQQNSKEAEEEEEKVQVIMVHTSSRRDSYERVACALEARKSLRGRRTRKNTEERRSKCIRLNERLFRPSFDYVSIRAIESAHQQVLVGSPRRIVNASG